MKYAPFRYHAMRIVGHPPSRESTGAHPQDEFRNRRRFRGVSLPIMKPTALILAAAWILSLAAAFLVGRGSSDGADPVPADPRGEARSDRARPPSAKSPRTRSPAARSGHSARPGEQRSSAIVAGQPPRQAVVELAQLTDPMERAKGFLALIENLAPEDFRDVVADFRALGMTEERMSEYGMLLHAWGKSDPVGALQYAMKETGTPFARQTILASWAADDPAAAVAFARDNHQGDGANPLLVGAIRGIAPSDLVLATELLEELPYSRERGDALQSMLPFVLQDGVEIALDWTEGIADKRLKSGALTYIVSDLSENQPEEAARVLLTLEDQSAAVRVADEVAGSLARVSIEHAITWSEGLPDDVRAEAVEGIVGRYASQDPDAASRWLESLSGTTNLDAAIRSFAWTTQRREPQLAAEWIGRIGDDRRRTEMYHGVLSRWLNADQAAATSWIQSRPDLPENIRELPTRLERERERRARGER